MSNDNDDLFEILEYWKMMEHSATYVDQILDFFEKTEERIVYDFESNYYPNYAKFISRISFFFNVISKYAKKVYVDYCTIDDIGIGYIVSYKKKIFGVAKSLKGEESYFLFNPEELDLFDFDVIEYEHVMEGTISDSYQRRVQAVEEFRRNISKAIYDFTLSAQVAGISEELIRNIINEK